MSDPDELEILRRQLEVRKLELETRKVELEVRWREREEAGEAADAGQARIYTFYGPVDRDSVMSCMAELALWARRDPSSAIRLVFNSPGGSVYDGLALFDFLQELRINGHSVETVALGRAASMGAVLLQAGTWRVMGRNALLLIHETSGGSGGKFAEMVDTMALMERVQAKLVAILAERSTLDRAGIKERWERRDWWLDAAEALELGFCDEVR